MSLAYSLDLDTRLTPDEVQRVLDRVPLPATHGIWRGPAVAVTARSQEVWEETYGFKPTVGFVYQLNKFAEDPARQELDVLANINALLLLIPGDLYVTYLDDLPVLRRIGGRVVVSSNWIDGQARRRPMLDDFTHGAYEIAVLTQH